MRCTPLLVGGILAFGLAVAAQASPVASGFDTSNLGTCDDCYSGAVALGFSANFYGTTYSSTYVSNNGYMTFGGGQDAYTPTGLGAGYSGLPIIAPFYADVDTRGAGSGVTSYGTGTYAGHNAFGVNYPNVGYYNSETDKLNTFQAILVDRSDIAGGDFDIYFNYGSINWETGSASGGTDGLGGTSAAVGFSNGSGDPGTYYQLPGSLVPGSFLDGGPYALSAGSNDGTPGQYLFEVRNGAVVSPVPEPASFALVGAGLLGLLFVRRRQASAL